MLFVSLFLRFLASSLRCFFVSLFLCVLVSLFFFVSYLEFVPLGFEIFSNVRNKLGIANGVFTCLGVLILFIFLIDCCVPMLRFATTWGPELGVIILFACGGST